LRDVVKFIDSIHEKAKERAREREGTVNRVKRSVASAMFNSRALQARSRGIVLCSLIFVAATISVSLIHDSRDIPENARDMSE